VSGPKLAGMEEK